jgi:hypothetical protein
MDAREEYNAVTPIEMVDDPVKIEFLLDLHERMCDDLDQLRAAADAVSDYFDEHGLGLNGDLELVRLLTDLRRALGEPDTGIELFAVD